MAQGRQRRVRAARQVVLLVLAIALPTGLIIGLGMRLLEQERELELKRAADHRRQLVADVRQELLARLARVRDAEIHRQSQRGAVEGPATLAVVLEVRGSEVVPPWERSKGIHDREGWAALQAAHRIERKQPAQSAEAYQRLMTSSDPLIADDARFALARILARSGRFRESDALNRALAERPFDVTDEYGMPLAVYAAQRLLERGEGLPPSFFVNSLASMEQGQWPSPGACYAIQEIARTAAGRADAAWATKIRLLAAARASEGQRVLNLQQEGPSLLRQGSTLADESRWVMTGNPPWLATFVQASSDNAMLVAVDAAGLAASLSPVAGATNLEIVSSKEPGDSLGDALPGVRLKYTPSEAPADSARLRLQRSFYAAVLTLVVAVTALGVFLLWRDVRREIRVTELRAQFVASVSHELKTPLTSIRMFAETLRTRDDLQYATRAECLDTIVSESERLTRLLNNVLDFSRIEQGRKMYDLAPVDLAEVLRASLRAIEYPLVQERFDVRLEVDESVPPLHADRDAIQQAVLNLLTNAMKYSGECRTIALSVGRDGDTAVISVSDGGCGIAPEDVPRLFDRFFRARSVENQHVRGAGLGLTIVQHVAEAHGGSVSVESAPGRGSTFRIRLPVRAAVPGTMATLREAES